MTTDNRSASCVVVPNIPLANGQFEGFGLVAVEAAAAGGIVLAANCGGLAEAVIDGQTGHLLEPANGPEWLARIKDIARWDEDRRRVWIAQSVAAVEARFRWPKVAAATVAAYGVDRD